LFLTQRVPQQFAEQRGLLIDEANMRLRTRYKAVEGTLDWYCVDYWTCELGLDIPLLKQEVKHLIAAHPHVLDFLHPVRAARKRVLLVTNAHGKALDIKFRRTQLSGHFDAVASSHDLRCPKEHPGFWHKLETAHPFDKSRALLVDDSLPVLRPARDYGVAQLWPSISRTRSWRSKDVGEFAAMHSFRDFQP